MISKSDRIFIAGHRGLVGSALVRRLRAQGYDQLILRTHDELDLLDRSAVDAFFVRERPDIVLFAAAKVGGIYANSRHPADFIADNLQMEMNVICGAFAAGIRKLLFLGSACIYPRLAPVPISEDSLLTGSLEPTNAPFAVAKIAGITLCDAYNAQYGTQYVSVMPTNLYGPGDTFHKDDGHVLPSIMLKMHEAKAAGAPNVTLWGTGTATREFLHVDDLADACVFLLEKHPSIGLINIGTGVDISIAELARTVANAVGFRGEIRFDASMPDGTPRRRLDVSKLFSLGWKPAVSLEDGIRATYEWLVQSLSAAQ